MTIRLPEGMREELNRIAEENGRSANAEIVFRLRRSLDPALTPDALALRTHFDQALSEALRRLNEKQAKENPERER